MPPQSYGARGIELFRTDKFYIFLYDDHSLWWDRSNGRFEAKTASDLVHAEDPSCLGILYGIVGKISLHSSEDRLLLVRECSHVGNLPGGHPAYKIRSVSFLSISEEPSDLLLDQCRKHKEQKDSKKGGFGGVVLFDQKAVLGKTWGSIKSAGTTIKNTTQQAAALATLQVKPSGVKRDSKDREKFERRIIEELGRIFTETDSFYFSLEGDLTNTLQRQCNKEPHQAFNKTGGLQAIDDRFFWNKAMLQDIISLETEEARAWIVPVIQGFVQIEPCQVEVGYDSQCPRYETFTLTLISRRSRFRAGTRYKRRGVDEDGKCANYVETEQIVSYHSHVVSFVQVRGSVPVFWSQPGYKYRPPPRIDKGELETQVAFEKHFEEELKQYGPVCIVNLVEQAGKERIIWDSYTNHILLYNSPQLTYVTFDFHEYCRGMHFENVSVLVDSLVDVLREMGYCWRDKQGPICYQKGVFRVNCIDCLDRTNVVQTALAKAAMEIQLYKLGLIPPEGAIPSNLRSMFQQLWANNGDIISKQYAGTNALKGDYTRTGERKLSGMMKDGMNSANRYYQQHFADSYRQAGIDLLQGQSVSVDSLDSLNKLAEEIHQTAALVVREIKEYSPIDALVVPSLSHDYTFAPEINLAAATFHVARYYLNRFKDVYRQATIDFMLGNPVSEEEVTSDKAGEEEEESGNTAEHVKLLIEDCKKMLISDSSMVLGAWGLIDADPVSGDPTETDMDTILILTRDSYYVADYDEQMDRITKYQQVSLRDVSWIEQGVAELCTATSLFKQSARAQHHCLRIHYSVDQQRGYFHMFRSAHLRFFNNVAVEIRSQEEMIESLKAVFETFLVAVEISGITPIRATTGQPLEKMKSRVLLNDTSRKPSGLLSSYLDVASIPTMTRNVSESQLSTLKSVGSKAISNVTSQFTKLNRLGQNLNSRSHNTTRQEDQLAQLTQEEPHKSECQSIQPNVDSVYGVRSMSAVRDILNTENMLDSHSTKPMTDTHLPSVGIVMSHGKITASMDNTARAPLIQDVSLAQVVQQETSASLHLRKYPLLHSRTDLMLDVSSLVLTHVKPAIREQVIPVGTLALDNQEADQQKLVPPTSLLLQKHHSHSSGEVSDGHQKLTSESSAINTLAPHERTHTLNPNIIASKSENSLKTISDTITQAITSPVASTAKDIVLSPFSKLAKGMQHLGANLDPRKLKHSGVSPIIPNVSSKVQSEENHALVERWKHCNTKLIAL